MNSLHASPVYRLALGPSRITVRCYAQVARGLPAGARGSKPTGPPPLTEEQKLEKKERLERKRAQHAEEGRVDGYLPGHGERIWIHNHIYDGHVMYSFHRVIDQNKGFRQMPYTGKKLVPAKIRKDYWRPMALVEFGAGLGDVGRSVFQKLREFKKRHELEWGRADPEEEARLLAMSRHERGRAINDQRANCVADVAAVLSGVGKGTKMWMLEWDSLKDKKVVVRRSGTKSACVLQENPTRQNRVLAEKLGIQVEEAAGKKFVDWASLKNLSVELRALPAPDAAESSEEAEEVLDVDAESLKVLHKATVYWAAEQDRFHARDWTENVEHVIGLPEIKKKKTDGTKKPNQSVKPRLVVKEAPVVPESPVVPELEDGPPAERVQV